MAKRALTVGQLADALAAFLIFISAIGSFIVGVAYSAGALRADDQLADIQSVQRTMAGLFGAFAIAVGAELLAARQRAGQILVTARETRAATDLAISAMTPQLDGVLKHREQLGPWTQTVAACQRLQMSGLSLRTFTNEHLAPIRSMLQRGGTCQFLLLKPNSRSSAITAKNFLGMDDPAAYDREIDGSLRRLLAVRRQFPGQVEVRTLDHIPAASITVIDSGRHGAAVYVELYTEEESSIGRPHLELRPEESPVWYGYFQEQFNLLWKRGEDVQEPGGGV